MLANRLYIRACSDLGWKAEDLTVMLSISFLCPRQNPCDEMAEEGPCPRLLDPT